MKWTGLDYDHATWELENSSFMKSPEAVKLIGEFESRHKGEKRISCPFEGDKVLCDYLTSPMLFAYRISYSTKFLLLLHLSAYPEDSKILCFHL